MSSIPSFKTSDVIEVQVFSAAEHAQGEGLEETNQIRSSHHQHPPQHIPVETGRQFLIKIIELELELRRMQEKITKQISSFSKWYNYTELKRECP